jgi:hypothetical protein
LQRTASLAIGPRRVFVGVGTDEAGLLTSMLLPIALRLDEVDAGAVVMSRQLATNLKAAAMNHPEVMFVAAPGAHHEELAWAARFPAAIEFLFPKKP